MTTRVRAAVVLLAASLVLITGSGALAGWLLLHRQPDWYLQAGGASAPAGAAEQMEAKLIHLYNRVAAVHAWRVRQRANVTLLVKSSTTAGTSHAAEQPFQITFSDDELNAFFDKWASTAGRREALSAYVEDPRLQIRPGEMIVAARIKRFHAVVSLELAPDLDSAGQLRMNLRRVYGGVLPLPEPLWASERDRLVQMMDEKYAQLQPTVQISSDGSANAAASAATMNRLLVATLQHQSAEPVLFLPYDLGRSANSVPSKVQAIRLEKGTLTLQVREMTSAEREALLAGIRQAPPHALATVP